MAGKLERTYYEMTNFIKDDETRKQFKMMFEQLVEQNKDNVIAFIPIADVDEDKLDLNGLEVFQDYDVLSGNVVTDWGDEIASQSEYNDYLADKADKEFEDWTIVYNAEHNVWHLLENPKEPEDVYSEHDTQAEAEDELVELKEYWIASQSDWDELEINYHEVYWNTVWRFNGELDRDIADRVGLGYLVHNHSGDEYLFLLGCGMDLSPNIIAYQALAFGYIEEKYLRYFEGEMAKYTRSVMGDEIWEEVLGALGINEYFMEEKTND